MTDDLEQSMQNNQLPYDTSFAYAFKWTQPEHLDQALNILNTLVDDLHDCSDCPASKEEYTQIGAILASNPDTPTQVLDHLSKCANCPDVLERVAGNPNVDGSTLKRLAKCKHDMVRSAVAENLDADGDIVQALARDGNVDVRFALAENPNVAPEVLDELCNDENPYVAYRANMTRSRISPKQDASVETMRQSQQSGGIRKAM